MPDELFDAMGRPRDYWLSFLGEIAEYPDAEFRSRFSLATRHIRDTGVSYRVYGEENERSWPLNPLPLILGENEWAGIAAGVEQRARLMEALLRDLYGEASLMAAGALPAAAITGSPDFIRSMRGVQPPGGRYLQLYAADLGRGPDGRWWVLDDRTQAPSGAGYALENRLVLSRAYPDIYNAMNVQRLAPFFDRLRRGLAATAGRADPRICMLTPGPFSETYFEQAHLARYLGFLLVQGDDLVVRDGRVYVRTIAGLKRADVLVRRVDADFIDPLELNGPPKLGTPGLVEAIRSGGVAVLNLPGSGVLESKALLGFLPRLSRRLLGEELQMPNIATWWCGQPLERARVEADLAMLAIAPAFNEPGPDGVTTRPKLMADLSDEERDGFLARFRDRPGDFVGQEVVRLSTTPVLREGSRRSLRRSCSGSMPPPRRTDPASCQAASAGSSDRADVRAISMGDEVRTADVWVIGDKPVERVSLLTARDEVRVQRIVGQLPSRAADNLFWLGRRYLERAEATLRLVRSLCTSLMDSEAALHSRGENAAGAAGAAADRLGGVGGRRPRSPRARRRARGAAQPDRIRLGGAPRLRSPAHRGQHARAAFGRLLDAPAQPGEPAAGARRGSSHGKPEGVAAGVMAALQIHRSALGPLAGKHEPGHAGWRFLDMGRRIERGVNTCRFARILADEEATIDDLDLLLDLVDSQITYRARYLVGLAPTLVSDMVMLDPYNTRSLAFQIAALKDHLAELPSLLEDGVPERPARILLPLASEIETADAISIKTERILAYEQTLSDLSGAIADRYFLQGANAVPTARLPGFA